MDKKIAQPNPPDNLDQTLGTSVAKYLGDLIDWLTGSQNDLQTERAQLSAQLSDQVQESLEQIKNANQDVLQNISDAIEQGLQSALTQLSGRQVELEGSISQAADLATRRIKNLNNSLAAENPGGVAAGEARDAGKVASLHGAGAIVATELEKIETAKQAALQEIQQEATNQTGRLNILAQNAGAEGVDAAIFPNETVSHGIEGVRNETETGVSAIRETVRNSHAELNQEVDNLRTVLFTELRDISNDHMDELIERMEDMQTQNEKSALELSKIVEDGVDVIDQRIRDYLENFKETAERIFMQMDDRVKYCETRLNDQKEDAENQIQTCVQKGLSDLSAFSGTSGGHMISQLPDDDGMDES